MNRVHAFPLQIIRLHAAHQGCRSDTGCVSNDKIKRLNFSDCNGPLHLFVEHSIHVGLRATGSRCGCTGFDWIIHTCNDKWATSQCVKLTVYRVRKHFFNVLNFRDIGAFSTATKPCRTSRKVAYAQRYSKRYGTNENTYKSILRQLPFHHPTVYLHIHNECTYPKTASTWHAYPCKAVRNPRGKAALTITYPHRDRLRIAFAEQQMFLNLAFACKCRRSMRVTR